MPKAAKNILVGLPADVAADLDLVCPPGGRTRFIVAAIREKLYREPAAQRARQERGASIKAAPVEGRKLTPAEAAQWWHDVEQRPGVEGPAYRWIRRGGELVLVADDELTAAERKQLGGTDADGNE